MGLFVRREDTGLAKSFYTLQKGTTKLIIGLGNIGKDYTQTRHNVGFMALDVLAESQGATWITKKDLKCQLAEIRLAENKVLLIKPTTMMNLSGEAAHAVQRFYKIPNADTVAIYDEVDLQFGTVRGRVGGSSGGHNGVKSLIQHIGEDFSRVRIGVSNSHKEKTDTADFVLAKFSRTELLKLPDLLELSQQLIADFVAGEFKPHTIK